MNYELYMRAALAEAVQAGQAGERANGAVVVVDEAMVAHGRDAVIATGDPTAHAVIIAVREAATRLGRRALHGTMVFTVVEPCVMCVGALQQCGVDGVVYALADAAEGACASALNVAEAPGLPRRLHVVSGILRDDAVELRGDLSVEGSRV